MTELAGHYGEGPVPVETIARNQEISAKYIHLLALRLRAAGLVRSIRGPSGGYELAKDPAGITALDVVSALEGPSAPVDCVDNPEVCQRSQNCVARDVWRDVASAVAGVLSSVTLSELARKQGAKGRRKAGKERGAWTS